MPLTGRTGNVPTTAQQAVQTHSSPRPSGTALSCSDDSLILPRKRQPVTDVSNIMPYHNPKDKQEYKHGDFSFESPPDSPEPDLVLLPNKGGLKIKSTHDTIAHSGGSEDLDPDEPQVRSTSSSYPSEGMRSPSLTVSPPMTFGRRILWSLEAYGFSNAHLSFLRSTDSSSQRLPGTQTTSDEIPQPEAAENHIWDYLAGKKDEAAVPDIHHEKEKTDIDPADCEQPPTANLVRSISAKDQNKASQEGLPHSNTYPKRRKEPRSTTISTTHRFQSSADVPNLSTQCLPRASEGPEGRPSFSTAPQLAQPHKGSLETPHFKPSSSSRRDRRHGLRQRIITHYFQLRKTVNVKKWIVKKFRAGRKGSKVVVGKVKERRARFGPKRNGKVKVGRRDSADLFHGSFHGGEDNSDKRGSLTRSIRSLGVKVFGAGAGEKGKGGSSGGTRHVSDMEFVGL